MEMNQQDVSTLARLETALGTIGAASVGAAVFWWACGLAVAAAGYPAGAAAIGLVAGACFAVFLVSVAIGLPCDLALRIRDGFRKWRAKRDAKRARDAEEAEEARDALSDFETGGRDAE